MENIVISRGLAGVQLLPRNIVTKQMQEINTTKLQVNFATVNITVVQAQVFTIRISCCCSKYESIKGIKKLRLEVYNMAPNVGRGLTG